MIPISPGEAHKPYVREAVHICNKGLLHIQVSAGDESRMAGAEMSCMAGADVSCMAGDDC